MPHTRDDALDQEQRVVAGLATGEPARGRTLGEEQLPRLARDPERVEVRQQPDAARWLVGHLDLASGDEAGDAVDLGRLYPFAESLELIGSLGRTSSHPAREVLWCRRAVRAQVGIDEGVSLLLGKRGLRMESGMQVSYDRLEDLVRQAA